MKWSRYNFDLKLAENFTPVTITETYRVLEVCGQIRNV